LQLLEATGEKLVSKANERFLTRRELAAFLTEHGFPISRSTLEKLSMPKRAEGPPAVGFWGNRALYDPDRALIWARKRFRTNWRGAGRDHG
jgi:hypothetical protein